MAFWKTDLTNPTHGIYIINYFFSKMITEIHINISKKTFQFFLIILHCFSHCLFFYYLFSNSNGQRNNRSIIPNQTFASCQDVFKTSSRHVLKRSSSSLQRNSFSSFFKILEDILQEVLKTSRWKKNCYTEDVFKKS